MSLISDFIDNFNFNLVNGTAKDILSQVMSDDMTGWGITTKDNFNCIDELYQHLMISHSSRKRADCFLEPLDSFGNEDAFCIACRYKRDILFDNGLHLKDDDLRFSLYLVKHGGRLKIRHGHLSKPWTDSKSFPDSPFPIISTSPIHNQIRLSKASSEAFLGLLAQREKYVSTGDLSRLVSLRYPGESTIYFPFDRSRELRGESQYTQYHNELLNEYESPDIKFYHPAVFQNDSLACIFAYAVATLHKKGGSEEIRISPLRVTYMLQYCEDKWLCRHTHWSIPQSDYFSTN